MRRMTLSRVPGLAVGFRDATSKDNGAGAVCANAAHDAKTTKLLPTVERVIVDFLFSQWGHLFTLFPGARPPLCLTILLPKGLELPEVCRAAGKILPPATRGTAIALMKQGLMVDSFRLIPFLTGAMASLQSSPPELAYHIDATLPRNLQTILHKSTNFLVSGSGTGKFPDIRGLARAAITAATCGPATAGTARHGNPSGRRDQYDNPSVAARAYFPGTFIRGPSATV
jgi:hypothetical protein